MQNWKFLVPLAIVATVAGIAWFGAGPSVPPNATTKHKYVGLSVRDNTGKRLGRVAVVFIVGSEAYKIRVRSRFVRIRGYRDLQSDQFVRGTKWIAAKMDWKEFVKIPRID